MSRSDALQPLLPPLASIQRLLARFNERGMVIGGVAASLLGRPRLTADVDVVLLLSVADLPHLMKAAAEECLLPRIADAENFARRHRVLLLRHEMSGVDVDVSLGILPFEVEAVERSEVHQAESISIRLPTPEDLIILKAIAHRPKDLQDIEAVIQNHPHIDRQRIRHWVQEFADALEMPELWNDIADWLK